MARRKATTKREIEREHFEAEARKLFGTGPRLVGVTHDYTPTASQALDEEQRQKARHDPAKASGCRGCGVNVEPDADGWRDIAGWKTCRECVVLLPDGLAAVISDIVGTPVTHDEVDELTTRTSLGNPCAFVRGWANRPGTSTRWAHVDPALIERAPPVLAEIRARGRLSRNSFGTGCCWCGAARSTRWTTSSFRAGRSPDAPRFAACADCEPWIARSGVRSDDFGDWRPHLLACCVGMDHAQMGVTFDLRAYFEAPGDHSGTAAPWAYLGGVRSELRLRVATMYPRRITLTDRERRIAVIRQAADEAGTPPERTALADLG